MPNDLYEWANVSAGASGSFWTARLLSRVASCQLAVRARRPDGPGHRQASTISVAVLMQLLLRCCERPPVVALMAGVPATTMVYRNPEGIRLAE